MKLLIPLLLSLALSGCSKGDSTAAAAVAERTYTVNEFLAQPDLRKRVSSACSNDPGRMALEPNCVNVRRADHLASAGTIADMPRVVP
jgi:hypothetical protein